MACFMLMSTSMRNTKSQPRKLSLSRETLRRLAMIQLEGVRGGLLPTVSYCTDKCPSGYDTCFVSTDKC